MSGQILSSKFIFDYEYAGTHELKHNMSPGMITQRDSIPTSLPVYVLDANTLQPAYFTYSDENGHWLIQNVDGDKRFFILSRDMTRQLNSDVVDWVYPVPPVSMQLTVTNISPAQGTIAGGTKIELTGTRFGDDAEVLFDGIQGSVIKESVTKLIVTTPPGAVGLVGISINTLNRSLFIPNAFEYI